MSSWRFIVLSLTYHWRINLAVALGVAAATAVLTGALLVGDSVRGSLRRLTLDRLGRIDNVLVTDRFFAAGLAAELRADPGFARHFTAAVPAILFPRGTLEKSGFERSGRAAQVLVVGCGAEFWELGDAQFRPTRAPGRDEIVLNAPLAAELQAGVGDEVLLRLPKANQVPADSPLGRRSDRIRTLAGLRVIEIVPAESLGRFSLSATQATPRNAYLASQTLQDALGQQDRVNAVLVAGRSPHSPPAADAEAALAAAFQPQLADYGLSIQRVRCTFRPGEAAAQDDARDEVVFDYFSLTTDRMLFSAPAEQAARQAWQHAAAQPLLTYLANSIERAGAGRTSPVIPYSLITAVDSDPGLGPLWAPDGRTPVLLEADEIVLNSWAAADLNAQPGDPIRVTFYKPETAHDRLEEETAEFVLKAIVPLTEPRRPYRRNRPAQYADRPTPANDPDLTPVVEGVTDQESISRWEAPFPVDHRRIRPQDDDYWANHRTTPKAFVSLAAGRRLWGSRFGEITSVRVPAPPGLAAGGEQEQAFRAQLEQRLLAELHSRRANFGFDFLPVKQRGLAASKGATPFDVLFLFLSFFIIIAALMLVALLFRLGVERRAREVGTLLALGFPRRLTMRLLCVEGALVAAAGGLLGVGVGVGYAWLMVIGLRTWWIGAISTPFLRLFVEPRSLAGGYLSGVAICVVTVLWSVRRTKEISVRRLLAGQAGMADAAVYAAAGNGSLAAALLSLAVALALAFAAPRLGGDAQAGAFVGSGTLVLVALLILLRRSLKTGGRIGAGHGGWSLGWLAARNVARHPGRSTLTVGLMAVASFLIVAMSSFRLAPTESGTGGFDLMAESAQPVFGDWSTPRGRETLLADRASVLAGGTVLPLRLQAGDDASCSNLYQASRPRVIGVSDAFVRHFDDPAVPRFAWAGSAAESPAEQANPWRLLADGRHASRPAIPVMLDKNMAVYSLHLYRGIGEEFELTYPEAGVVRFRVAGLLSNCVLQGSLLIGESDFVRLFAGVSGYRFFLIRSPAGKTLQVAEALEDRLGDQGFDAASTRQRLEDQFAIQNTYLSTFQSLGALGLLLGTFGLATVQVRNVIERRGELALLRAAGFRRRRLAGLVMLENVALLLGGLLTGFAAALVTTLPHMLAGGASIPLVDLTLLLAVVLLVGCLSSLASVRATLQAPILAALREE